MPWRRAVVLARRTETATAVTLLLHVEGQPAATAGQRVEIRLTAEDGYTADREYSLARAGEPDRAEITVQAIDGGEVSPFLVDELEIGSELQVRGPIGGWFVWRPDQTEPVLLVAGGSGIVPLMAMVRARREAGSKAPFRLVYSVRSREEMFYRSELRMPDPGVDVTEVYTREAPEGSRRPAGRLTVADVNTGGWPPDFAPTAYICGPTGFVESAADMLLALGHDARRIRTERFGPTS
ncbi:ferredoxin reductase [Mumia sp. zg.B17]|uniref:ferredoxin reductase n=1 Tax=Mumia sp. zg.B17 TaxID=2855446 RepID=UPI001C6F314F|nr:ferredoxin reductase [Mumia sp. zg.B17]MBW9207355.1 ferredoxin reductase [Mumia sp. zg.B17]